MQPHTTVNFLFVKTIDENLLGNKTDSDIVQYRLTVYINICVYTTWWVNENCRTTCQIWFEVIYNPSHYSLICPPESTDIFIFKLTCLKLKQRRFCEHWETLLCITCILTSPFVVVVHHSLPFFLTADLGHFCLNVYSNYLFSVLVVSINVQCLFYIIVICV